MCVNCEMKFSSMTMLHGAPDVVNFKTGNIPTVLTKTIEKSIVTGQYYLHTIIAEKDNPQVGKTDWQTIDECPYCLKKLS